MTAEPKDMTEGCLEFSYTEPLRNKWQHEVLDFHVAVPRAGCDPATFYVTDEAGTVIPAQFTDPIDHYEYRELPVTVSLIADFEPWQKRTWTLHYGGPIKPVSPGTDLQCTVEDGTYVISNSMIAVRTGMGSVVYDKPVEAGSVPAPLMAVRGINGKWLGRGWLESPQRVTSYDIRMTHDGPIFKRVRAEYRFDGGYYACIITLRSGEDTVHIREEFDLGEPSPLRDSNFCFGLYEGFAPDTVRWAGRYGDKRFVANDPIGGYEKQQEAWFPVDYGNPGNLLRLHGLFVWWPEGAGYFGAYRQDDTQGDFVGIFPERPGHWSNPTVIFLESTDGPDLVLKAPIRQPEQNWVVDGVDYRSPYFIGSVDPGTIRNRGVREWGILLSRPAEAIAPEDDCNMSAIRLAQSRYGQNPLNKIKEWVLDWKDGGAEAYPRGFLTRAQLPALRDRVGRSPELQAMLEDPMKKAFAYLVTQDPLVGHELVHAGFDPTRNYGAPTDDAGLLPRLRWSVSRYLEFEGDLGIHTCMHHGNYHLVPAAPLFDAAMSVPGMTQEERREAKALYAFLIYKLSDPDWLAYGSGFHLGTPNMPTMSLSIIGSAAAVIPDHPMSYEWMMKSARSILDMLRTFTAPGGAWRECPHYQMDASLSGVIQSATVFRNAGFIDLFRNGFFKAAMLYHAQLLTPVDPRLGIRTMPAIGNGSHEPISLYGRMAAGTAESDPEYSRWMQWAWLAVGNQYWYAHDEMNCDIDLPASVPDMASRHFPGFGAVMRSHFGEAAETYLIFRMGYQHEHYENDQGEIVLYAKGVPLLLDFGSQYEPLMQRPWMHNRINLNRKLDEKALGEITETAFLDAADACLGSMTITVLESYTDDPKDKVMNNVPRPEQVISPVTWERQVMLVKHEEAQGPHYVLLRDGFTGDGDDFSESTLWCLADSVATDGNNALFKGQHGVDLSITVVDPADPGMTTGEYGHTFIANTMREYFDRTNGPDAVWNEVQRHIRVRRTDHKGYFMVLYPHTAGETVPTFTPWEDGAGVQTVIDGERHVAICAETSGIHSEEDMVLDGQRALFRQGQGRTLLSLLSGKRIQAGGYALEASGPVSITFTDASVSGEANLVASGDVAVAMPGAEGITTAYITTDGTRVQVPVAKTTHGFGFRLPAGKCTFTLA